MVVMAGVAAIVARHSNGANKIMYMHKIFKDWKEQVMDRTQRQFKVIEISNRLQAVLGIGEDDIKELEFEGGALEVDNYWVIAVNRDFKPWVTVLEITEAGQDGEPGLTHSPSWLEDKYSTGVTTTNIPPEDVVEYVIEYLEITK